MSCIICDSEEPARSIEHIVSESLGNAKYVIPKGKLCDECNAKFSKFEATALSNSVLVMERARLGIKSKKGKTAKGVVEKLKIEGAKDFGKNKVVLTGLNSGNLQNYDPTTGKGHVFIKSFDKSEVAMAKLLLKMGIEALYTSQRAVYNNYDFSDLKEFLISNTTRDWPFITSRFEHAKFKSIPKYGDKYALKKFRCELLFIEVDEETMLLKFKYGSVEMVINLLNRRLDWMEEYFLNDDRTQLYPEHFRRKRKPKPPLHEEGVKS